MLNLFVRTTRRLKWNNDVTWRSLDLRYRRQRRLDRLDRKKEWHPAKLDSMNVSATPCCIMLHAMSNICMMGYDTYSKIYITYFISVDYSLLYILSLIASESVWNSSTCPRLMTAMHYIILWKSQKSDTVMVIVLLAHSWPASVNICRNGSSNNMQYRIRRHILWHMFSLLETKWMTFSHDGGLALKICCYDDADDLEPWRWSAVFWFFAR